MDPNEVLGIMNARQQVKLVRRLRKIREARGFSPHDVAELMKRDHLEAVTGPDFVREFEAGGMNYSAAVLRSYAKAIGAELELNASIPNKTLSQRFLQVPKPTLQKEWGSTRGEYKTQPMTMSFNASAG